MGVFKVSAVRCLRGQAEMAGEELQCGEWKVSMISRVVGACSYRCGAVVGGRIWRNDGAC